MHPGEVRTLTLLLALLTLTACAKRVSVDPLVTQHIILVDPDGLPLDPADNTTPLTVPNKHLDQPGSPFHNQLDSMFAAMREFHQQQQNENPHAKKQILIFIHGGLNSPDNSRDTAVAAYRKMLAQHRDAYPIFINWDSGFVSAYLEELRFIRGGTKDRSPVSGPFTAPFYLAADLGRAIAAIPLTYMNQLSEDAQTTAGALGAMTDFSLSAHKDPVWDNPRLRNAAAFYLRLEDRYRAAWDPDHPTQIAISLGSDDDIQWPEWAYHGASYGLTIPFKLVTGPLINGLGKPAWENMRRRTTTMFVDPNVFIAGGTPEETNWKLDHGNNSGAVSCLLDRLADLTAAPGSVTQPATGPGGATAAVTSGESDYEITIVAHSMGTIVANNILSRYPDLPVKNIVYMAAACTIADFQLTALRFMEETKHHDCQFYNLCLHPIAETLDTEADDFVPRGSLLVWIDNYLENPRTPLERTMGRWENIVEASFIFPENMRGRIHLKAFSLLSQFKSFAERGQQPQRHGDFAHLDFWDPAFWTPDPPIKSNDPTYTGAKDASKKAE